MSPALSTPWSDRPPKLNPIVKPKHVFWAAKLRQLGRTSVQQNNHAEKGPHREATNDAQRRTQAARPVGFTTTAARPLHKNGIKTATGGRAYKMREPSNTKSRVLRTCHDRSPMPCPAIKPAMRGSRGLYQCRVDLEANRNRRKKWDPGGDRSFEAQTATEARLGKSGGVNRPNCLALASDRQ